METERIHYLNKQERHSVQRACFMRSDNILRTSFNPALEGLFHKLSASKTLQVGEQKCSKRLLTADGDLTIPSKRRKLTQESNTCDASTHHDVLKSENEEELKFEKEHLYESTPNSSENAFEEGKIELNLQSSVFIKVDDSAKFIRLKCFDSITLDGSNNATFFVGGPIQSSAFCVTPSNMKINQYIAIAASNSFSFTKHLSGIIQFWNLGSLYKSKMLSQKPSMGLALCHDNGIATQMKWCPVYCYNKHPATSHLPRLGLLAVSFSDSFIYIYSVPQPEFMPKLKSELPIYFTLPSMKLIPLSGEPCSISKKSVATCFEWEKTGERIVAGYGNGAVCVWLVKVSSSIFPTALKSAEQPHVIQPYLFFQAAGASITSLSCAPFGNLRWLAVSSIDKSVRFFDLCDISAPFSTVKQGLENSCLWAEAFCGVYSSASLNLEGLITLSVKECCTNSIDYQKGVSGFFDSSTHVVASENKSIHVSADMAGTVSVHYIQNASKPYETSYLTNIIFETQVVSLDRTDQERKTSKTKINISGNYLTSAINLFCDIKGTFDAHTKHGSSSSSSFCSPKRVKPIVIQTTYCFEDDAANLHKNHQEVVPTVNDLKDFVLDDNKKVFLNEPLKYDEESTEEMGKYSKFSEDLMHNLLMRKISNFSKSSSDIFSLGSNNNPNFFNSGDAKDLSGGAVIQSSTSSSYSCKTVMYPLESYFCDTSDSNAFKYVEPNAESECLGYNKKGNTLNETTIDKMEENVSLKADLFPENCSTSAMKLKNSHNNSSKNWCESNLENCDLNKNNRNLKKGNCSFHLNSCHFTSKQSFSNFTEEHHNLQKFPKEDFKSDDILYKNLNAADSLMPQKGITKHSLNKSDNDSLCNDLHSNNMNKPDVCSSSASDNFVICDKGEPQPANAASNYSFSASDYSADTIIYSPHLSDCNKPSYVKPQIICKNGNDTFCKVEGEESDLNGFSAKCSCAFAEIKCLHFHVNESLRCNSENQSESVNESSDLSDQNGNFSWSDCLASDFHLLHSEYLCHNFEENHKSKDFRENDKDPQGLPYETLCASFGVIFRNHSNKPSHSLKSQKNDIYVNYNPLSVIKTLSWNPNEHCNSWLFVGGNSGIGRLFYVPDLPVDEERPQTKRKKKRRNKCNWK